MSKSIDVLITSRIPQTLFDKICQAGYFPFMWEKVEPIPQHIFKEKVNGVKGILCTLSDKLDTDLLKSAGPNLKTVSTISVGLDHVDIAYLKEKGITLGYTPGILTEATAEIAISLLLATSRKIFEANKKLFTGQWSSCTLFGFCGKQLSKSTVGIFGLGKIGKSIAMKVAAFHPQGIFYTGSGKNKSDVFLAQFANDEKYVAKYLDKEEFITKCDVIIVACSFNKDTENFFDKSVFEKMPKNTIFINISRGKVVNQKDLINALNSGHLYGAGLDVMTPEPIPLDDDLLKCQNCTLLPHIGSATTDTRTEMCEISVDNLLAGLEGKPLRLECKL